MVNVSWIIPETRRFPAWQKFDYNRVLPSVWIRGLQMIPHLQLQGVQCRINQISSQTDAAIFLRSFDAQGFEQMKKARARGLCVFMDTPVNYFSEAAHPAFEGDSKKYFDLMAPLADGIFCASRTIQESGAAKGFKTYYFPDAVDTDHFSRQKAKLDLRNPVLLWSGSSSKAQSLNFLAPLIRKKNYKIILISNAKPKLDFSYEFLKWNYQAFPCQLLKGDLGIFPRDFSNPYDQGHSFFKIGVCLAMHIPVIYSPVPSYEEVTNASNSLKVEKLDVSEWEQALLGLADGHQRFDFSDNPVKNQYSLKTVSQRFAEFLREATALKSGNER